jgi:DNA polymerase-1
VTDFSPSKPQRLFILDAMALLFRSYHAFIRQPLRTQAGFPTSALYGSAMFILKLLEDEKPDYLLAATDTKQPTFRHELYAQYKAHRTEMPEELAQQVPAFYEMLRHFQIPLLVQPGVEADDLIASVMRRYTHDQLHGYIVSGDKDFMQLIQPHIFLYTPKKGGINQVIDRQGVFTKFGCFPEQVVDILALCGDTSDNVPGVHGIGEKGAAKLILEFTSLEGIYEGLDRISNARHRTALETHREMAFLSKRLVTLDSELPVTLSLKEISCDPLYAGCNADLYAFFQKMEFSSLSARLQRKLEESPSAPPVSIDEPRTNRVMADNPYGPSREYFLVNTKEALESFLAEIQICNEFSFDTETTGLNLIQDRPIGISFSFAPNRSYYLPLLAEHLEDLTATEILTVLRPFFSSSSKTKIAHNIKFDQQMLRNIGIEVAPPWGDTMLISFLLDSSRNSYSLDTLSKEFLGIEKIPTTALMGPKKTIPMASVDLDLLYEYACEDADCTLQLHQLLHPKLFDLHLMKLYHNVELPIAGILSRMEQTGIHVDAGILQKLSLLLNEKKTQLEIDIHEAAGTPFNIASPKQLSHLLFEKLEIHKKLGVTKLRKTTQGFSTDSAALEELSADPFVRKVLEYRSVAKLVSTYVDQLPTMIDPQTGRIHTSFHQTGTATGRLSASNPNLQNIPIRTALGKEIRTAFTPRPHHVLISADYSQIELRILAHLSQDPALLQAFREGKDIHIVTASRVWDKSLSEVTSEERSQAKAINYGILYGMGPKKLSKITGLSMEKAKAFIAKYFQAFPTIQTYIEKTVSQAKTCGYTETVLGRRRPIPGIRGELGTMAAVNARNMAINSPIQGTAADLIKLAMIQIQRTLEDKKSCAKMLLQVHDELIFECPQEEEAQVKEWIRVGMEHVVDWEIPLAASVGSGQNWLEAH